MDVNKPADAREWKEIRNLVKAMQDLQAENKALKEQFPQVLSIDMV